MYNNPYEEYMRNSLGYNQIPMANMNYMNMVPEMYETEDNFMCNKVSVEDMYPEVYKIVYPMICKACMAINENITEDLVSRITNEVYMNVEYMGIVNEDRSSSISVSPQLNKNVKSDSSSNKTDSSINNNLVDLRQETRRKNPLLNDLIGDYIAIAKALGEIDYQGDFTYEANNFFKNKPLELIPATYRYACEVGRYLIGEIEKTRP